VDYLKKASGKLVATTIIDPSTFFELKVYPGRVDVPVEARDSNNILVTKAQVFSIHFYLISIMVFNFYFASKG
jgi:hypothetical protein